MYGVVLLNTNLGEAKECSSLDGVLMDALGTDSFLADRKLNRLNQAASRSLLKTIRSYSIHAHLISNRHRHKGLPRL